MQDTDDRHTRRRSREAAVLVHRIEQMVHRLFGANRCTASMLVGRRVRTDGSSVWVGPLAAALLAMVSPSIARASERADVPVRQTVLPDGEIRYSVPVTVGGGPPIEAALDTGSFGLRVLASALSPEQYEATEVRRRYPFGSGTRFDGTLARATIGVGSVLTDAPVLFQRIDRVDCVEDKPDCPASKLSADDYRIAGDGYPGQGFQAILGLSLRRAPVAESAASPLAAAGDRSWIVVLPRPGSLEPGHLIVDPDARDRAGFTLLKLDPQPGMEGDDRPAWADAALPGCLVDRGGGDGSRGRGGRYCGRILLDTGAPGLSVATAKAQGREPWGAGRRATLEIGGTGAAETAAASVPFVSGQGPATAVVLHPPHGQGGDRGAAISAGTLPYFSYAVLYDAKAGTIGFKPRGAAEP